MINDFWINAEGETVPYTDSEQKAFLLSLTCKPDPNYQQDF